MENQKSFVNGDAQFFSNLFINSPIGIFIVQDRVFRFVNPAFCKVTGYTEAELIGMDVHKMVFPKDVSKVKKYAVKMLKGERSSPYLYRLVEKHGEIRWIIETVTPILYHGQRATLGHFMDNSKLMEAEQALRESEVQRQAILDGISTSLVFLGKDLKIIWANHAAGRSLEISPEEMIGHTCHEFCSDLQAMCDKCPVEEAFKSKKTAKAVVHTSNKTIWNVKAEPVFDDHQNTVGVLKITHDVTEEYRLESRLIQVQKVESLGRLAGGIAHDFNNVLSIIMNCANIVSSSAPETDRVIQKNIDYILTACRNAKELVDQILSFSRIQEVEQSPVDVKLLIENVLRLFSSSLPNTVKVVQGMAAESGIIMGDESQIQQVLMNLLTNAHHAMGDKGGVLKVTLTELEIEPGQNLALSGLAPGPYLDLGVSDTGHGMDEETIERIFDPYYTTKKKGMGTGLGLAVVKGVVKNHGGKIRVYSKPGEGAFFHVYLPRIQKV